MSFELAPVKKIPADIQAADLLRNSIVSGKIASGARITEQSLSRQLQLSRATVRLALHQLSAEGLVVLKPYSGWSVAALTSNDAWELSTLRASLERTACLLITRTLTDSVAKKLRKAFERLVAVCEDPASSDEDITAADFDLHMAIVHHSGNERLIAHYTQIDRQIRRLIQSSNALLEEPATIIDQHRPIVAAILDKEAEKAASLMERHNMEEGEKLTSHLQAEEAAREKEQTAL